MAIADDIILLDNKLNELIIKYEQYFIGLEKREPLQLLGEVEKLVRRHTGTPINNTMYKHRFTMLVARLVTYREHWNRILKLMEEGRYSRDRFITDLHLSQKNMQEVMDAVGIDANRRPQTLTIEEWVAMCKEIAKN